MVAATTRMARWHKPAAVASGPGTYVLTPNLSNSAYLASSDAVYATARSGSALSVFPSPADYTFGDWEYLSKGSPYYDLPETLVEFDITPYLGGGTISSATFKLNISVDISAGHASTLEMRAYDYGPTITTADWVAGASIAGTSTLACSLSTTSLVVGTPVAFTNNGTVLKSAISTVGPTRFLIANDRLRAGTTPTGLGLVSAAPAGCTLTVVVV